jgi:hypothetical protein
MASPDALSVALRRVEPGDLPAVSALEAAAYPADEAATPDRLAYRARAARELFYVMLAE